MVGRDKSTETARTWCWNSTDTVWRAGAQQILLFFCTHFCSGNCQQFQGQESVPATFKGSSCLIYAVIMQHAAGFKLHLKNAQMLWGKEPPITNNTRFDNTSNLTADMTFGGSGKFLDSVIQKKEKKKSALFK